MATCAARLVECLVRRGETLGTAESCTGGGVGFAVTAVPGASRVFMGGVVSYGNRVKRDVLGVAPRILDGVGPVSAECAAAMARGARRVLGVDYAVSVTGVAGPGGDGGQPAGYVWFGVATGSGVRTENVVFPGGRDEVRAAAIEHALEMVCRCLSQSNENNDIM